MEYKLKWPDVKGRKEIKAIDVKYGDVVAVAEFCRNSFTNEIEFGRTGLAVMESPDWAIWYINLCKEEGREWVNDPLPDDVMLFEPTEEEEYFGKLILLQELFNTYSNPFFNGQVITDATIASNPQPIGFRGNLLVKRQKFFYCTYSLGITETS